MSEIKKGDLFKSAPVVLARGLLNRDNARSIHNGILAYTLSDATAVSERLNRIKRSAPRATDTHVINRSVTVTAVLKTKIKGIFTRVGDVYTCERPAPFNPADRWITTARVNGDGDALVSLSDLSHDAEVF